MKRWSGDVVDGWPIPTIGSRWLAHDRIGCTVTAVSATGLVTLLWDDGHTRKYCPSNFSNPDNPLRFLPFEDEEALLESAEEKKV